MPKRSTPQTDAAQRAAALRFVATRFPGATLSMPPGGVYAPIDYFVREASRFDDGRVIAVVEVKCRRQNSTTFPTVWAEERKIAALTHWSALYEAPGYFVVEWADKVMRYLDVDDVKRASGHPVLRRRGDRGDPLDSDVVYEVPVAAMTEVP